MIDNSIKHASVRFPNPEPKSFSKELRKRVNAYFKEKGISKKGNYKMTLKTIGLLSIYLMPYAALYVFQPGAWLSLGLFLFMGFGMSVVGMGVMHDAAHGAYHVKNWVNKVFSSSIYIISGNATTWRLQHNVLHHTYTNIDGLDDDLETRGLIRLHPGQEWKKVHKAQVWYAPFLYSLLTLNWVISKDFNQLLRYQKNGIANFSKSELKKEWYILVATKVLYFAMFIVLPILFLDVAWYIVIIGFIIMHFVAGFLLSFVFQLAHVVDHVETFEVPTNREMEDAWMEHQLRTTSDFAQKNKLIGWFVGGLNFQVEHHLFPNICHIHYPDISKIVERTAKEFNLPYNRHNTMIEAVKSHLRSLKFYSTKPAF